MIEIQSADAELMKLLPPVRPDPGSRYIPSQFAVAFECSGKQYIFNTLTKQCVEAVLPPSARAGEGYDGLIRRFFLVPEGRDECAFYQSVYGLMRQLRRQEDFRGFTILPTSGCNARCVYCYQEGMKRETMSPETVEQTIRFILTSGRSRPVLLSWFGGEPLLCPDIIDSICQGLRDGGAEYTSSMISNGSLIRRETVERMTGLWRLKSIQISMDGPEEEYIRRKRYAAYHDEYHAVLEAVSLMAEAGISVQIRCNVDTDNIARMPVFLEELKAGIRHREKVGLYLIPLYSAQADGTSLRLRGMIRNLDDAVAAAGFRFVPSGGIGKSLRLSYCLANAGGAVIAPDGSLYACEQCVPKSRFGNVWDGVTDQESRSAFCRTDRIREKCRSCPYLPYCTGFSACPVQEKYCREAHAEAALELLKKLAENREAADGENAPVC